LTGPRDKGLHRVAWDLRLPSSEPVEAEPPPDRPVWWTPPAGALAPAGTYSVALTQEVNAVVTPLAGPEYFHVVPLEVATAVAQRQAEDQAFRGRLARLQRAVLGALRAADEARNRLRHVRKAILETPGAEPALLTQTEQLSQRLDALLTRLRGDETRGKRNEPTPPSVANRVEEVVGSQWNTTTGPTQTQLDGYRYAGEEFAPVLADLRALIEQDLVQLEAKLEAAGAPWTPGRVPTWHMEGP
jgi:hypothetical protein